MPEVQEVFRMATEKVRQDPGALDRQVTKQLKAARSRRIGVFATVMLFVVATIAALALTHRTSESPATHHTASPSIVAPTAGTAIKDSTVDIYTGQVTPLPASILARGDRFAASPDGTRVATWSCCNRPSPLYLSNADGTNARVISPAGTDAYLVQFSASGDALVYQQRDYRTNSLGNLVVVTDIGGQLSSRTITDLDQTKAWKYFPLFPTFTPDGKSVLYQMPKGDPAHPTWDLWTVPVGGGQPTLFLPGAGWGGIAPDGWRLAFASRVSSSDFSGLSLRMCPDLTDPRSSTLLAAGPGISWTRWSPDGTMIAYTGPTGVHVLDVASGTDTFVGAGSTVEWFDAHTLVIGG
jgi:Tol biopolymer transport system component